jgi:hypothetical protein
MEPGICAALVLKKYQTWRRQTSRIMQKVHAQLLDETCTILKGSDLTFPEHILRYLVQEYVTPRDMIVSYSELKRVGYDCTKEKSSSLDSFPEWAICSGWASFKESTTPRRLVLIYVDTICIVDKSTPIGYIYALKKNDEHGNILATAFKLCNQNYEIKNVHSFRLPDFFTCNILSEDGIRDPVDLT